MKYRPFYYKNTKWNKICFGLNRIFTICIFNNGIIIEICYFGTILKKYDLVFSIFPLEFKRVKY